LPRGNSGKKKGVYPVAICEKTFLPRREGGTLLKKKGTTAGEPTRKKNMRLVCGRRIRCGKRTSFGYRGLRKKGLCRFGGKPGNATSPYLEMGTKTYRARGRTERAGPEKTRSCSAGGCLTILLGRRGGERRKCSKNARSNTI